MVSVSEHDRVPLRLAEISLLRQAARPEASSRPAVWAAFSATSRCAISRKSPASPVVNVIEETVSISAGTAAA